MPVYILIVEDGNGHSEIVAFWLAASEDRTTIKPMGDLVVGHNPCANQARDTVITQRSRKQKGEQKCIESLLRD